MAIDVSSNTTPDRDDPGVDGFAIVPNDATELAFIPRSVYVGGAGNVVCRGPAGTADLTFINLPSGSILPFSPRFVRATGTTATNLIGLL